MHVKYLVDYLGFSILNLSPTCFLGLIIYKSQKTIFLKVYQYTFLYKLHVQPSYRKLPAEKQYNFIRSSLLYKTGFSEMLTSLKCF